VWEDNIKRGFREKIEVIWIGFIWLRTGASGRLL
jgi:hypothetical protein